MGFESRAISARVTKQIVTIFSKTCGKIVYVRKNNYMDGSGSATILTNAAHPQYQEEEEPSPNRNHIITNKQQQTI